MQLLSSVCYFVIAVAAIKRDDLNKWIKSNVAEDANQEAVTKGVPDVVQFLTLAEVEEVEPVVKEMTELYNDQMEGKDEAKLHDTVSE